MIYGYIRINADRRTITKFCKQNRIAVNKWTSKLPATLRRGDVVVCSELPRFGNIPAIVGVLNACLERGVDVWSVRDNFRLGDFENLFYIFSTLYYNLGRFL